MVATTNLAAANLLENMNTAFLHRQTARGTIGAGGKRTIRERSWNWLPGGEDGRGLVLNFMHTAQVAYSKIPSLKCLGFHRDT